MRRRKPALVEKVNAKLYASQLVKLNGFCEQNNKSRSEAIRSALDQFLKDNCGLPLPKGQPDSTDRKPAKITSGDYHTYYGR